MNEINGGTLKVSTTATEFSYAACIFFREDARSSSLLSVPLSNTHLVYTTEDLRPTAVELTRFFDWMQSEKSIYALRIG
jgi:hypothetical protein